MSAVAVALCAYCREADAGECCDVDGDPICAECNGENDHAAELADDAESDDDGDDCGHCYGSGGGPDAALRCRYCGGTGRAGDTDLDRATYDEWRWEQRRDDRMCGGWD